MTIKDMHYDFKMKANKVDSQKYRNLLIPEIDWIFNEASQLFVESIFKPKLVNQFGFQAFDSNIDDIRPLILLDECSNVVDNLYSLPSNYWHYINGYVTATKGSCSDVKCDFIVKQFDDILGDSAFSKSSFEWREVNGTFHDSGITFENDGSFTINSFCMSYMKKLSYIHNAEDFKGGSYKIGSTTLTGSLSSELPDHTHRKIVDFAIYLFKNQLDSPTTKMGLNKILLDNSIQK